MKNATTLLSKKKNNTRQVHKSNNTGNHFGFVQRLFNLLLEILQRQWSHHYRHPNVDELHGLP